MKIITTLVLNVFLFIIFYLYFPIIFGIDNSSLHEEKNIILKKYTVEYNNYVLNSIHISKNIFYYKKYRIDSIEIIKKDNK